MAQPCKLMPGHRPALKRPQSPFDEASVPRNFLRDHLVGYCQRWKVEADQNVTKLPHLEISVCAIAADEQVNVPEDGGQDEAADSRTPHHRPRSHAAPPVVLGGLVSVERKNHQQHRRNKRGLPKNSNALIVASMRMTWLPNSQPAFIGRHSPPFSIETLNEVAIQLPDMQLSLSAAGRYTRSVGGY